MTEFSWLGGTQSLTDPMAWDPSGVPGSGDVGSVYSGNVTAVNQTISTTLVLRDSYLETVTLNVSESTLNGIILVEASNASTVGAVGLNRNAGVFVSEEPFDGPFGPASLVVNLADLVSPSGVVIQRGVLINTGSIGADDIADTQILGLSGDAELVNSGGISTFSGSFTIDAAVTGTGQIGIAGEGLAHRPQGTMTFGGAVSAGQTIDMYNGVMILEDPLNFRATISGFGTDPDVLPYPDANNARIEIPGRTVTSALFVNHVLNLLNGSTLVAQFGFGNGLTSADFVIQTSSRCTDIIDTNHGDVGNVTVQTTGTAPVAPSTTPLENCFLARK